MCGRFSLVQRLEILERMFRAKARSALKLPRYNVAPTQPIAAICMDDPQAIQAIEWGFTVFPKDGTPPRRLINAKAETLDARPAYRDAFSVHRCLILADGFFEWQTNGTRRYPKYFRLKNRQPFAFAGLYHKEGEATHGVIVTTAANELVATAHTRMPVVLRDPARWLDPATPPLELQSLLQPFPQDEMEGFTVDPIVNSPEHDSPQCIAPFAPPQLPLF
ncbi:MAG: SOS response-associated peptidase [Vulcanimicrobiaceae bacterium]